MPGWTYVNYHPFKCWTRYIQLLWRLSTTDSTNLRSLRLLQTFQCLSLMKGYKHYSAFKCLSLGTVYIKSRFQILVFSILSTSVRDAVVVHTFGTILCLVHIQLQLCGMRLRTPFLIFQRHTEFELYAGHINAFWSYIVFRTWNPPLDITHQTTKSNVDDR